MEFQQLLNSVTPEIYKKIKTAVEIGKWANGIKLTKDQIENSIQILIAYDAANKAQGDRVGYVPVKKEKDACDLEANIKDIEQTIKWKN
ncbi:MAG: hypothetical protein CMK44_07160 [Porticoccus sp.]|jgi:uncharacterized protein YeaC (DUF1315 family)|nr:hypothetical protein [Porticoccus sp.]|tara:strand:+ start:919 stop:1185 length:267 start_codon:yes stop_codon:yes gene_type:complete